MPVSETKMGKTPNGGIKSTIYYRDDKGNPVDSSRAKRCEIVEFDAEGKAIFNTYGYCNGWTPDQDEDVEVEDR
jgi:hypothetical protein